MVAILVPMGMPHKSTSFYIILASIGLEPIKGDICNTYNNKDKFLKWEIFKRNETLEIKKKLYSDLRGKTLD